MSSLSADEVEVSGLKKMIDFRKVDRCKTHIPHSQHNARQQYGARNEYKAHSTQHTRCDSSRIQHSSLRNKNLLIPNEPEDIF